MFGPCDLVFDLLMAAVQIKEWIDSKMMPLYTVMASMSLRDYEQLHKHREQESREWRVTPNVVSNASVLARIPATEAEIEVCHTLWSRRHVMCAGVPAVPVVPTAV